jgi:hemerythrin-like metal-binding protein
MLEWSDKYLVGIDRIDSQHKALFSLIADFEQASARRASKRELSNLLEEISLYSRFHFKSEEDVMETLHYPDIEKHRDIHSALIESLSSMTLGFSIDSATPDRIRDWLVGWLTGPILSEDSRIAEYEWNTELSGL